MVGRFDVARRTIHTTQGLSRYMAVCLLLGYARLAVAGFVGGRMTQGSLSRRGVACALGLGFVMSMVMGPCARDLPAVARIKVHYDARFYLPLWPRIASLLLRCLAATPRQN